jgi:hypothetical protein
MGVNFFAVSALQHFGESQLENMQCFVHQFGVVLVMQHFIKINH